MVVYANAVVDIVTSAGLSGVVKLVVAHRSVIVTVKAAESRTTAVLVRRLVI